MILQLNFKDKTQRSIKNIDRIDIQLSRNVIQIEYRDENSNTVRNETIEISLVNLSTNNFILGDLFSLVPLTPEIKSPVVSSVNPFISPAKPEPMNVARSMAPPINKPEPPTGKVK